MAKFIIRRLLLMLLTMLVVSIAVFLITEAAPGNVARNVLGIHITPEQEASFLNQQGLDEPFLRPLFQLADRHRLAGLPQNGLPVKKISTEDGFREWWAVDKDGTLIRWEVEGEDIIAKRRQPGGEVEESLDNGRWEIKEPSGEIERLKRSTEEIQANEQIAEEDRQAILDQSLIRYWIYSAARSVSKAEMLQALEGPESALRGMIDQDVPCARKSVFTGDGQ